MKNFLKRLRLNFILTSLLCIAVGVVLIVFPETMSNLICRVIGISLAIFGLLRIVGYVTSENATFGAKLMLVEGILLVVIGAFIIIRPDVIKSLLTVIIGILLMLHALIDFKEAYQLKKMNMRNWWIIVMIALVTAGLGVLLICRPIKEFYKMLNLIGACLIIDGVSDVVVYGFWKYHEKLFRKSQSTSGNAIIEVVDGKVK